MSERLTSVGLDVGTTSTQLVVSELLVENRAAGFAVPELEITQRNILYRSPVYFTPLLEGKLVDGTEIRRIVEEEYQIAGISREMVDTGAIIITGETSRRENARSNRLARASRGGRSMTPASTGSTPSASAGRESVTRLSHKSCTGTNGICPKSSIVATKIVTISPMLQESK